MQIFKSLLLLVFCSIISYADTIGQMLASGNSTDAIGTMFIMLIILIVVAFLAIFVKMLKNKFK